MQMICLVRKVTQSLLYSNLYSRFRIPLSLDFKTLIHFLNHIGLGVDMTHNYRLESHRHPVFRPLCQGRTLETPAGYNPTKLPLFSNQWRFRPWELTLMPQGFWSYLAYISIQVYMIILICMSFSIIYQIPLLSVKSYNLWHDSYAFRIPNSQWKIVINILY